MQIHWDYPKVQQPFFSLHLIILFYDGNIKKSLAMQSTSIRVRKYSVCIEEI